MLDLMLVRPGPSTRAEAHWNDSLPLGIGYLAASARDAGLRVAVVDGRLMKHRSTHETVTHIRDQNPTVVGISALTVEYLRAAEIAAGVKRTASRPTVVLGGAHANALPRASLAEAQNLDYVIAGEGEASLVSLVRALRAGRSPSLVAGLYSRSNTGTIENDSPPQYDLSIDGLPFPAWDLFPKQRIYPLMTERGCPYSCVFCSRNMSRRVRSRSVDHVMEEIRWLDRDFAPERIYIEDETFGLNSERATDLLSRLAEFNRDGRICFKAQTRVDRITPQIARLMKKAGFRYLEIGIESGDERILANANKGFRLDEVESRMRTLVDAGIKTWVNFIIGLPGETPTSVRKSIDLSVKLNPNRLSVAIIVAYPGCDVYDWATQGHNGYRLLTGDWSRFDKYLSSSVELEELSYSSMRRWQLQMYFETYLRNLRVGELLKLLWRNRTFVRPVLQSMFRSLAI